MDFSYFDIIVAILILFLGLKGIINGFFKEFFGLLGIIGGIFIASRVSSKVGEILSNAIFKLETSSAINFLGFIVTLVAFWLLMIATGTIFKKLSSMSGLGAFDKILGFIFSAGKFFLIASVMTYASLNIKAIKISMNSITQNSILIPIFSEVGGIIMKLDIAQDKTTDTNSSLTQKSIQMMEETKKLIDLEMQERGKDVN